MKNHEWNKARRTLKKAARIDKTNTTTLRFLREVDEQTGVTTNLEKSKKGLFHSNKASKQDTDIFASEQVVQQPVYKERSGLSAFFILMAGIAAGVGAFWLLAAPAIRQGIYKEANQQIVQYSESLASQAAELTKAQSDAKEATESADEVSQQLTSEQTKSKSYQALLQAYAAYQQKSFDDAALELQNVQQDVLSDSQKTIYNTISQAVNSGNTGSSDTSDDGSDDSGEYDDSESYE